MRVQKRFHPNATASGTLEKFQANLHRLNLLGGLKKANYLSIHPKVLPINRLKYNKKEVKIIHKKGNYQE